MAIPEVDKRFRLEPTRIITFKAQASLVELMNRASRLLGMSRSELIREAVYHFILYHLPELVDEEYRRAAAVGVVLR